MLRYLPLALLLYAAPAAAQDLRVIDGDTIELDGEVIRLFNIDAPETAHRARCDRERDAGEVAKARMTELLGKRKIRVLRAGKDGSGRTLAFLIVRRTDPATVLIQEGLAFAWEPTGASKKRRILHWCPNADVSNIRDY